MLFQTLDDKKDCIGIYTNGNLYFNNFPENLSKTWSYSEHLRNKNIEYANLYCGGKSLDEVCPDSLKKEWEHINLKMKSFVSSFVEAKVSLHENCFFDLTPEVFLRKFYETKNKITQNVFDNYEKPKEYAFYLQFSKLLEEISNRNLNINLDSLKLKIGDPKALEYYRKMLKTKTNINYNMFGSVTGRLTTEKNSFPILLFPKLYREILKPTNDWFISFDMNAAELRTSLALIGKDQTEEDLHEKIRRDIFSSSLTRSETKAIVTAWLYNSSNPKVNLYKDKLNCLFEKEKLLNTYWDGKYVYTPFSRKIESDKHNAISHLNQSTFIDLFHRQVLKVSDYLKDKKSFVSFLLHDEFVLDVKDEEKDCILQVINLLQDTQYGKFIVNVKAGRDFGNMKKLKLKA